jgi:hypothetical protein
VPVLRRRVRRPDLTRPQPYSADVLAQTPWPLLRGAAFALLNTAVEPTRRSTEQYDSTRTGWSPPKARQRRAPARPAGYCRPSSPGLNISTVHDTGVSSMPGYNNVDNGPQTEVEAPSMYEMEGASVVPWLCQSDHSAKQFPRTNHHRITTADSGRLGVLPPRTAPSRGGSASQVTLTSQNVGSSDRLREL